MNATSEAPAFCATIPSGWCCRYLSHPGGVGVPCAKADGAELCAPCWREHTEAAAGGRGEKAA